MSGKFSGGGRRIGFEKAWALCKSPVLLNQKQRREMKVALRKVTECVSGVALDFQEEKWDIAKWSMPLEISIPIEWTSEDIGRKEPSIGECQPPGSRSEDRSN